MNPLIKKNIRLLSEKHHHSISYGVNEMLIANDINTIKITPERKYGFKITYNTSEGLEQISSDLDNIYDVLIDLLKRHKPYKLISKNSTLIHLENWIDEEGGNWIKKSLKDLSIRYDNGEIEYEDLGGNRFELEFYKGLLILVDDLCIKKSNVIDIKTVL